LALASVIPSVSVSLAISHKVALGDLCLCTLGGRRFQLGTKREACQLGSIWTVVQAFSEWTLMGWMIKKRQFKQLD
jgi:hypothetical protein